MVEKTEMIEERERDRERERERKKRRVTREGYWWIMEDGGWSGCWPQDGRRMKDHSDEGPECTAGGQATDRPVSVVVEAVDDSGCLDVSKG